MTDKRCAYIAGPMTGRPNWNHDLFNECEGYLLADGWQEVINPAKAFGGRTDLPRLEYLSLAHRTIEVRKPAIVLLDEWWLSDGARMEAELGLHLGLEFWRYNGELHFIYSSAFVRSSLQRYGTNLASAALKGDAIPQGILDAEEAALEKSLGRLGYNLAGGYKASMDDPSKLPLHLIPRSLYEALGRSLGYGAKKYEAHNFRKGMAWSQPYAALLRHLTAWWEGEDVDADSGNGHLDNAAAMLCFLIEYTAHEDCYAKFDDRYRHPPTPDEVAAWGTKFEEMARREDAA